MAIIQSSKREGRYPDDDCNCEENDTATQKSITAARKKYCDALYSTAGEVSKDETQYTGQVNMYERRKCLFVWTEANYRRYRNMDICVNTELLQSNDLIKSDVSNYISWSNDLSSGLKNVVKAIKDLKTKMSDLRDAAGKLDNCRNDSCNCSQMTILTGEVKENCKDSEKPPQGKRPEECNDAKEVLDDLICMPKALGFDADYLLKAAADVVGIQVFSNLSTLDPLQKAFSDEAKTFGKFVQDTVKKREGDLKKAQDDLVKTVQDTAKTASGLYNERSDFEGLMCTTRFICCPGCDCVGEGNCEPRLSKCKEDICDICDEVKETFCKDGCNGKQESKAH